MKRRHQGIVGAMTVLVLALLGEPVWAREKVTILYDSEDNCPTNVTADPDFRKLNLGSFFKSKEIQWTAKPNPQQAAVTDVTWSVTGMAVTLVPCDAEPITWLTGKKGLCRVPRGEMGRWHYKIEWSGGGCSTPAEIDPAIIFEGGGGGGGLRLIGMLLLLAAAMGIAFAFGLRKARGERSA